MPESKLARPKKRDEFICGFAAAVGTLAREHGSPSMAADIMHCNGLRLKDFKKAGVEEFDMKPLRGERGI